MDLTIIKIIMGSIFPVISIWILGLSAWSIILTFVGTGVIWLAT